MTGVTTGDRESELLATLKRLRLEIARSPVYLGYSDKIKRDINGWLDSVEEALLGDPVALSRASQDGEYLGAYRAVDIVDLTEPELLTAAAELDGQWTAWYQEKFGATFK